MTKFRMKRILSLLLVLIMSLSAVPVFAATEFNDPIEYVNSDEYRFVKEFDLMPVCNYDDFQPEKPLTRAEFARILCALGGFNPTEGGNSFVDISANEYKGYIAAVNELKLMVGTDKYTFLPENNITVTEVLKTIVVLLGYDMVAVTKGGYPNGYLAVAKSLELTDGLTTQYTEPATRGDITKIIYNARNVELMNIISMGEYVEYDVTPGQTFMTEYLDIDYIKGVVTDNGITGLRGESEGEGSRIKIGDTIFKVDDVAEMREYIGRYVEAYHTYSKDDSIDKIRYIHIDKEMAEEEITFDMTDFDGLSGRTLKYANESGKVKEIRMSDTLNIIYNGRASKTLSADMFDYDYGTVTYVPAEDGNDDTLIIEGFVSWYISSVDREMELVRTTEVCPRIDGAYSLNIPKDDIGTKIFIDDEFGNSATITEVALNSVIDISKNGEYMYIRIAPLEADDKIVKSMFKSDKETFVTFDDDTTSRVAPYYRNTADFETVQSGNLYYVYKNSFGDITALVVYDNLSLNLGYLIGAHAGGPFDTERKMSVLTDAGKVEVLEVAEKIKWSDSQNNTSTKNFKDIVSVLKSYDGPINYKLNKDNKVTVIYMPVEIGAEREMGRLGVIFNGILGFRQNRNYAWDVLVDANVKTFACYESESDVEKRYRYVDIKQSGMTESTVVNAYNYEPNSRYADFFSMTLAGAVANPKIESTRPLVMIQDIGRELYGEDEVYNVITGFNLVNYTNVTLYISDEDMQNVKTTYNTEDIYTLTKGDIILYVPMASDAKMIDSARLLWRSDMPNPVDPDNGRRGGIAGSENYYGDGSTNPNIPYTMYGGNSPFSDRTQQRIVWTGYVTYVDKKGGIVLTTKDLSYGTLEDGWNDVMHKTGAFFPDTGRYGFVTYKDDEILCREATVSDIRPYLVDGKSASRAIVLMNYGRSDRVIIINGEMK